MDSIQIHAILTKDVNASSCGYLGVFSLDTIPLGAIHYPCALVCNTKPKNHQGEHWVAIIKDSDNHGFYFDSFGMPPCLPEFIDCMNFCATWDYNKQQLQSPFTTVCGQYCIFYLLYSFRGYSMENIIYLLNEGDFESNDILVHSFVAARYPNLTDKEYTTYPFIFKQISQIL